jgi:asparagine synthase (glutamine-hydrolysing)
MFRGINKLPAGHSLVWEAGKITVKKYWDLDFHPDDPPQSDAFYFQEVERLLRESVRIRMISDVPLGAFLSGGVDSSLVVAMMATQSTEPIKTFSIGFEDQEYNELSYARMVARAYDTDHHEEIVHPDAEKVIPEIIDNFDEPFADSSAIPTYYVSKLARRHVTVALSGDGGDEIFAGYGRYFDSLLAERLDRWFPQWLKGPVLGSLAGCFPDHRRGGNTLRYLAAGPDRRYADKMAGSVHRNLQLLHENLVSLVGRDIFGREVVSSLRDKCNLDKVSRRQYADVRNYLVGDILTKVDRCSMLVSLETRAPLLDHWLAEFAARLPVSLKVRDRTLKYVLKHLARQYLPHELIDRPKMGFAVPVGKWINNEWRELCHDLVLSPRALGRENVNAGYLRQIFHEHRSGMRDYSALIWKLMVLEMWYRKYIDG